LRNLPLRLKIHNLEGHPLGGAKYCRSAGNWAMVISKTNLSAVVMFANGKKKNLSLDCLGTIGVVSNASFSSIKRNKAGYSRLKGIRPSVRGVAMNPVDHPHGGGNGKKSPKSTNMSPWRKLGKGIKTTRNNA
jgi:large subunit ribosomal protein L2